MPKITRVGSEAGVRPRHTLQAAGHGRLTDPLVTVVFRRRIKGDLCRLNDVLERRSQK
jgi:hypothetical protein